MLIAVAVTHFASWLPLNLFNMVSNGATTLAIVTLSITTLS